MVQRDRAGTQARRCRSVSRLKQCQPASVHEIVSAESLSAAAAAATAAELRDIYQWVDTVTFSKLKKRLNRDMSDAIMAAELVHHYHPKLVDLHNYSAQNSQHGRIRNWETLNRKVLAKLNLRLSAREICSLAIGEVGSSEVLLRRLRDKLLHESPIIVKYQFDPHGETAASARRLEHTRHQRQSIDLLALQNLSRKESLLHPKSRRCSSAFISARKASTCGRRSRQSSRRGSGVSLSSQPKSRSISVKNSVQVPIPPKKSVQNGKRRELERTIRLKNTRLDALIEKLAIHLVPPHSSSIDENWTSKTPSLP